MKCLRAICILCVIFLISAAVNAKSDSDWNDPFSSHVGQRVASGSTDAGVSKISESSQQQLPSESAAAAAAESAISLTGKQTGSKARRNQQNIMDVSVQVPDATPAAIAASADASAAASSSSTVMAAGRASKLARRGAGKKTPAADQQQELNPLQQQEQQQAQAHLDATQSQPSATDKKQDSQSAKSAKKRKHQKKRPLSGKPTKHGDTTSPGARFEADAAKFGSPATQYSRRGNSAAPSDSSSSAVTSSVKSADGHYMPLMSGPTAKYGRRPGGHKRRFFKPTHRGNTKGAGAHFDAEAEVKAAIAADSEAAANAKQRALADSDRANPSYAPSGRQLSKPTPKAPQSLVTGYTKREARGKRITHMPRNYYQSREGHGRRLYRSAPHAKKGDTKSNAAAASSSSPASSHQHHRISSAQLRKMQRMRAEHAKELEHQHDARYDRQQLHRDDNAQRRQASAANANVAAGSSSSASE